MKTKATPPPKAAPKGWMLQWVDAYGVKKFWSLIGWSDIFAMRLDQKEAADAASQQSGTRVAIEIVPYVQPPTRSQQQRAGAYRR